MGTSVCGREKCALKRKPYPPGIHGKSYRRGLSEFGTQLREKQKVKFLYGLRERQLKNYVASAMSQHKIPTGDALVSLLELRLDNAVYRLGLASSPASARNFVSHGHIFVNGKRATIPSFSLKVGSEIQIRPASLGKALFANLGLSLKKHNPPEWLELDKTNFKGKIIAQPAIAELVKAYNTSAIVEYYSR